MITAKEAREIIDITYQTKLDNYIKEHQQFFDLVEKKIKEASIKMEYACYIKMSESIMRKSEDMLRSILIDRCGYSLDFNFYTNDLIIRWNNE